MSRANQSAVWSRGFRCLWIGAVLMVAFGGAGQPTPAPLIKQDARVTVSPHVAVIPDDNVSFVPNVGIVAGDRATLVVDTGLGERNGAIVLGEARKVSDNSEFYVAATHYHPEHDLGATAFPPNAKVLRWRAQQLDADELGEQASQRFAGFSPALADLLEGAAFRPADIVFDEGVRLDLGGVHVRVWGVGPTHTRGDTVFFVEEDRVLLAGDVVMPVFLAVNAQQSSITKWLADLDAFEALDPIAVVPAHGRMGDIALIRRCREYLQTLQGRVIAAKRDGMSIDAVVAALGPQLAAQFPDLAPAGGPAIGRINAAIQAAYREAP